MIQAIVALVFFLSFSERAKILQKNRWLWGAAGAGCFFVVSWGITELLARVVSSSGWSNGVGELLPFLLIGIGLVVGYVLTEQVKTRGLPVDAHAFALHRARKRLRTG